MTKSVFQSLCPSHKVEPQAVLRDTCWACGTPIKPEKAPRALCGKCGSRAGGWADF